MKNDYISDSKINIIIEFFYVNNGYEARPKEIFKNTRISSLISTVRKIHNKGKLLDDGSLKYKTDILKKEQIDLLNANNFKWNKGTINGTVIEDKWEYNYLLLKEFKEKYNRFPKNFEVYKGKDLGNWFLIQKCILKNGIKQEDDSIIYRDYTLTKQKQEKLLLLGMDISTTYTTSDKFWETNFNLLKEYLKENNNEYPKEYVKYKGYNLGSWVIRQREIFNNGTKLANGTLILRCCTLTKEQIDKLNSIGFTWVLKKSRYLNKIIDTKEDLEKRKRYLLEEFNRLTKNYNKEFESKEDIKNINKDVIKILRK